MRREALKRLRVLRLTPNPNISRPCLFIFPSRTIPSILFVYPKQPDDKIIIVLVGPCSMYLNSLKIYFFKFLFPQKRDKRVTHLSRYLLVTPLPPNFTPPPHPQSPPTASHITPKPARLPPLPPYAPFPRVSWLCLIYLTLLLAKEQI